MREASLTGSSNTRISRRAPPMMAVSATSGTWRGRIDVFHAGDFPEQLLHRARGAFLDFFRAETGHRHQHINHRHLDLWLLLARQHRHREQPQQHRGDDDERRELGVDKGVGDAPRDAERGSAWVQRLFHEMEAPNTKHQTPKKLQTPSNKTFCPAWASSFGAWNLVFLWGLDLGAWSFISPPPAGHLVTGLRPRQPPVRLPPRLPPIPTRSQSAFPSSRCASGPVCSQ